MRHCHVKCLLGERQTAASRRLRLLGLCWWLLMEKRIMFHQGKSCKWSFVDKHCLFFWTCLSITWLPNMIFHGKQTFQSAGSAVARAFCISKKQSKVILPSSQIQETRWLVNLGQVQRYTKVTCGCGTNLGTLVINLCSTSNMDYTREREREVIIPKEMPQDFKPWPCYNSFIDLQKMSKSSGSTLLRAQAKKPIHSVITIMKLRLMITWRSKIEKKKNMHASSWDFSFVVAPWRHIDEGSGLPKKDLRTVICYRRACRGPFNKEQTKYLHPYCITLDIVIWYRGACLKGLRLTQHRLNVYFKTQNYNYCTLP